MKFPFWYLIVLPTALFVIGFALNTLVMTANDNQMPVYAPGGCQTVFAQSMLFVDSDYLHVCMTPDTHLKVLADYIIVRDVGIYSPGDFLEETFLHTWDYALIAWIVLILKKFNE